MQLSRSLRRREYQCARFHRRKFAEVLGLAALLPLTVSTRPGTTISTRSARVPDDRRDQTPRKVRTDFVDGTDFDALAESALILASTSAAVDQLLAMNYDRRYRLADLDRELSECRSENSSRRSRPAEGLAPVPPALKKRILNGRCSALPRS